MPRGGESGKDTREQISDLSWTLVKFEEEIYKIIYEICEILVSEPEVNKQKKLRELRERIKMKIKSYERLLTREE